MKLLTSLLLALAAVLGGVLAYRSYGPRELHGTALDVPKALAAVPLLRDDGKRALLSDSGGRTRLVFFGYTRCPDVCPATLGVLARAWETLSPGQQAGLEVALISVDPTHDRPAVLRGYLDGFSPAFRGYTGTDADIRAAEKSLYVYAAPGKTPTSLIHGDGVALVSRGGRFLRVYANGAVARGDLTADLPRLVGE